VTVVTTAICQNCGFAAYADANASKVIKRCEIRILRAGEIDVKVKENDAVKK